MLVSRYNGNAYKRPKHTICRCTKQVGKWKMKYMTEFELNFLSKEILEDRVYLQSGVSVRSGD